MQPACNKRDTGDSEALYAHAQYNTQPVAIEGPCSMHGVMRIPPMVLHFSAFIPVLVGALSIPIGTKLSDFYWMPAYASH